MINNSVHFSEPGWQQHETLPNHHFFFKGNAYLGSQLVSLPSLAAQIASLKNVDSLTDFLNQLNGFFSWVERSPEGIRASVDHVRSMPLFYASSQQKLIISDSADWIRDQVGEHVMDPVAYEEFLLAGYVTGSDTLFPNVKQLQAGEYLAAKIGGGHKIELTSYRYYRFFHNEPEQFEEASLRKELNDVAEKSIKRLIKYADGRPIVVPLSGGYDSRLIVTLLKKFDYKNVLTFTYGIPGNREANYSQKTARSLGFKWVFEKYDANLWRRAWRTNEAETYRKIASNHTSLPHIQDWLAIKQLVHRKEIKSDSIIVPGHSGDFVAGSHIPPSAFTKKTFQEIELVQALVNKHLRNTPQSEIKFLKADLLRGRIMERIGAGFDGSSVQFANLFEMWDWQERQSKYIVNSCRVYDQFGLAWWLPLWDLEFIKFWERVPLILRENRKWYQDWVCTSFELQVNGRMKGPSMKNASDSSLGKLMLKQVFSLLPKNLQNTLRARWLSKTLRHHFLAFEGLVENDELVPLLKEQFNLIGIYSKLFLEDRW